ncbi:hypothetical protein WA026_000058 [Henosepilachna vigintioctopunctata]|uniref:COX assembly mitochondrial protein n=1 Tax=Henosepilachna vigintioctopunctata TaxID=420089 RepID=A0AAW1UWD9_9CUCU
MEGIPKEEYEECNKLYQDYKKCSVDYPVLKFFGYCSRAHSSFMTCSKRLYNLETAIRLEKNKQQRISRAQRIMGNQKTQEDL